MDYKETTRELVDAMKSFCILQYEKLESEDPENVDVEFLAALNTTAKEVLRVMQELQKEEVSI